MSAPSSALGMILKGYPRISESFISNEILLLERLGFTVHLLPMRHPREDFTHASVKQIKARVDYLPTYLWRDLPRLLRHNQALALRAPGRYRQGLALMCRRLGRARKSATIKHFLQAGYLVNAVLARQPEIGHLHAHFAHSPTSVTLFASVLSGLPFSFTAHAKDIYTQNPEQLREKIARARFVVTCTGYNKRHLEKLAGNGATPIHCVYHGIDIGLFSNDEAEKHPAPARPSNLLTVARMTEKKGLPTIYRALRLLRDQGLDFHHTLIGDGDDREALVRLVAELELTDCCTLAGTKTHEEVLGYFRRAHVFVLGCEIAANGDRDGIPNVLVESLAMGVPAVSTTVSAIPEIIDHERTGLTVPPRNPEALAGAIRRLLTDNDLRRRVRAAGRAKVQAEFDNRKHIEHLAAIFRQAMR